MAEPLNEVIAQLGRAAGADLRQIAAGIEQPHESGIAERIRGAARQQQAPSGEESDEIAPSHRASSMINAMKLEILVSPPPLVLGSPPGAGLREKSSMSQPY